MSQPSREILDLTPATLHQLLSQRAWTLLVEQLPIVLGLVRVTGVLSDLGPRRGQWYYGVRLADDGAQVWVDLPAGLAEGRTLKAGQWVSVIGVMRLRVSKQGSIEVRVEVGDVRSGAAEGPAAQANRGGRLTIEQLKALPTARRHFPRSDGRPLKVAVVQSSSAQAQVAMDCMVELHKLGAAVAVEASPVNILDPAAVATAIDRADAEVLLVIRGGGNAAEFDVFDDARVVTALARHHGYRVVGLGHTGNVTLLDRVADFSAHTPAQAGLHVREQLESQHRERLAAGVGDGKPATDPQSTSVLELPPKPMVGQYWWVPAIIAFLAGAVVARYW